jgi:hypothetical protein
MACSGTAKKIAALGSTVQTVTGGTGDKFSYAEQRESKQLWTYYQRKLSPETEIVYSKVSAYPTLNCFFVTHNLILQFLHMNL